MIINHLVVLPCSESLTTVLTGFSSCFFSLNSLNSSHSISGCAACHPCLLALVSILRTLIFSISITQLELWWCNKNLHINHHIIYKILLKLQFCLSLSIKSFVTRRHYRFNLDFTIYLAFKVISVWGYLSVRAPII